MTQQAGIEGRTIRYRPEIDGLRAIAILLVIFYHCFPNFMKAAFIGVDVFFVISGYLISSIIFNEIDKKSFSLKNFFLRRIHRILPPLLFLFLITWCMGVLFLVPSEFLQFALEMTSGNLFFANMLFWRQAGYFDASSELKPFLHLWSLGIEEQFYLFFPLVCLLLGRSFIRRCGFMILAVLTSLLLLHLTLDRHPAAAFFLLPTRVWELLLGSLLAAVDSQTWMKRIRQGAWSVAATLTGLIFIAASAVLMPVERFPDWPALFPTIGALLVIAAGTNGVSRHALSCKPMVNIGLLSYALYLWHWPLLYFIRLLYPDLSLLGKGSLCVALSLIMALISYVLIEKPIKKMSWDRRTFYCTTAMVYSVLVVLGLAGMVDGFQTRSWVTEEHPQDFDNGFLKDVRSYAESCGVDSPLFYWCRSERSNLNAAVIGDSHAISLFPGLAAQQEDSWAWKLMAHGETPPLFGENFKIARGTNRSSIMNSIVDAAAGNSEVHLVVLVSRGLPYIEQNPRGETFYEYRDANGKVMDPSEGFFEGYSNAIKRLLEAGKQVVVFKEVPVFSFDPKECVAKRPFQRTRSICSRSKSELDRLNTKYIAIMDRLQSMYSEVWFYDPAENLCPDGTCVLTLVGRSLYNDHHHLNTFGSQYVAKQFLKWLTQPRIALPLPVPEAWR